MRHEIEWDERQAVAKPPHSWVWPREVGERGCDKSLELLCSWSWSSQGSADKEASPSLVAALPGLWEGETAWYRLCSSSLEKTYSNKIKLVQILNVPV